MELIHPLVAVHAEVCDKLFVSLKYQHLSLVAAIRTLLEKPGIFPVIE